MSGVWEKITISQIARFSWLSRFFHYTITRYTFFSSFLFFSTHIVGHEVLLRWDCLARTHTHSFNRLSHRVLLFAHSASQSYSIALFRHTRLYSDILTFISTPCSLVARFPSLCAHSINIIFHTKNSFYGRWMLKQNSCKELREQKIISSLFFVSFSSNYLKILTNQWGEGNNHDLKKWKLKRYLHASRCIDRKWKQEVHFWNAWLNTSSSYHKKYSWKGNEKWKRVRKKWNWPQLDWC